MTTGDQTNDHNRSAVALATGNHPSHNRPDNRPNHNRSTGNNRRAVGRNNRPTQPRDSDSSQPRNRNRYTADQRTTDERHNR